jgi:uncharacterized radical SAM superfamily Fe-S cluster-containing enzyme
MYEGNRRFRDLVSERKDEYISAVKHEKKQKIAKELVNTIHASGGRFLCLSYDGRTTEGSNIVDSGRAQATVLGVLFGIRSKSQHKKVLLLTVALYK